MKTRLHMRLLTSCEITLRTCPWNKRYSLISPYAIILYVLRKIFPSRNTDDNFFYQEVNKSNSCYGTNKQFTYRYNFRAVIFWSKHFSSFFFQGLTLVPMGAGGTVIGGFLINRFNLSLTKILKLQFWVSLAIIPLYAILFLVPCGAGESEDQWAGITAPYPIDNVTSVNLDSPCNKGCKCSENKLFFAPFCGADQMTYFSPCYASCTQDKGNKVSFSVLGCISASFCVKSEKSVVNEFHNCFRVVTCRPMFALFLADCRKYYFSYYCSYF